MAQGWELHSWPLISWEKKALCSLKTFLRRWLNLRKKLCSMPSPKSPATKLLWRTRCWHPSTTIRLIQKILSQMSFLRQTTDLSTWAKETLRACHSQMSPSTPTWQTYLWCLLATITTKSPSASESLSLALSRPLRYGEGLNVLRCLLFWTKFLRKWELRFKILLGATSTLVSTQSKLWLTSNRLDSLT